MTIQVVTPAAIGDGAIINGVAHFVRPPNNGLAPATRIGGASLVVRDRWYNTNDGTEWSWNGTYWISPDRYYFSPLGARSPQNLFGSTWYVPFSLEYDFLLKEVSWVGATGAVNNSSNFLRLNGRLFARGNGGFALGSLVDTSLISPNTYFRVTAVINTFVSTVFADPNSLMGLDFSISAVGTPSNLSVDSCRYEVKHNWVYR